MSALQQFREARQQHEEKKVEKKTEQQKFDEIPKGAVMAICATNTKQRNDAYDSIKMLNANISKKREQHIDMLDRLQKYEDVEEEFYSYLEKENMMINCDSQKIGVYSKIYTYTTKKGISFQAHYTIHGHFLERCKKDDEKPISYTGWFEYKKYIDMFKKLMREKKGKSYKSLINGELSKIELIK
jgi:hypothetical protein